MIKSLFFGLLLFCCPLRAAELIFDYEDEENRNSYPNNRRRGEHPFGILFLGAPDCVCRYCVRGVGEDHE